MAAYRVLNPTGEVVDTKDIESADDAPPWFVDQKADPELGWRMEVNRPRASLGKPSAAVTYDR
jgi:hypothetical protein